MSRFNDAKSLRSFSKFTELGQLVNSGNVTFSADTSCLHPFAIASDAVVDWFSSFGKLGCTMEVGSAKVDGAMVYKLAPPTPIAYLLVDGSKFMFLESDCDTGIEPSVFPSEAIVLG